MTVASINKKAHEKTFVFSHALRTSESGVFEPLVKAGEEVRVGQPLANIIHPYESELIETLYAPVDGKIFFIHNAPLTYANTAVIKLVR